MKYEGDCRTALATPDLLITDVLLVNKLLWRTDYPSGSCDTYYLFSFEPCDASTHWVSKHKNGKKIIINYLMWVQKC